MNNAFLPAISEVPDRATISKAKKFRKLIQIEDEEIHLRAEEESLYFKEKIKYGKINLKYGIFLTDSKSNFQWKQNLPGPNSSFFLN